MVFCSINRPNIWTNIYMVLLWGLQFIFTPLADLQNQFSLHSELFYMILGHSYHISVTYKIMNIIINFLLI